MERKRGREREKERERERYGWGGGGEVKDIDKVKHRKGTVEGLNDKYRKKQTDRQTEPDKETATTCVSC